MSSTFEISMIFLVIYSLLVLLPGNIQGICGMVAGFSYFVFAIFFLIFIYQTYGSFIYAAITLIGLFVFMYLIQIILAGIKSIYDKPNNL